MALYSRPACDAPPPSPPQPSPLKPSPPQPSHHSRQSAAKRYKVTGSGKVVVRRAGRQHLNEKQSSKTKRNLRCVWV